MSSRTKDFIRDNLAPSLPPLNPILKKDWIGMAFDRNLYDCFAPTDVWETWLKSHAERGLGEVAIEVVFDRDLEGESTGSMSLRPTLDSLRGFWKSSFNFLSDHYVLSESAGWIVRLDQDVTLFSGELCFVNEVLKELGGAEVVFHRMESDFSPDSSDSAGLKNYLRTLLRRAG